MLRLAIVLLTIQAMPDTVAAADEGEPSCADLFADDGSFNKEALDQMAEIPFPPASVKLPGPPRERSEIERRAVSGHLMKWMDQPRLILVGDQKPPTDLLYAFWMFKTGLSESLGRPVEVVLNPRTPFEFKPGDLLVVVSAQLNAVRHGDARISWLIKALYGNDADFLAMRDRIEGKAPESFVDLVGIDDLSPDRAIVAFDSGQDTRVRRYQLFQFLTFAISPNPLSVGQQQLIYRPGFETTPQFDPGWSRLFRILLAVVFRPEIAPDMTREQFLAKAEELVRRPEIEMTLPQIAGCG
jgi:hypothetical protein